MATLTSKIASNTFVQMIARACTTILGLIGFSVLARYLGAAGYGAFTTATGFLQFFGILVDFGLTLTAAQMIAEPNADESRIMGNIFTLRFISGAAFFGLAALSGFFMPYPMEVKLGIAIGSIAYLGMTQSNALLGIFQKYLKMHLAAIAEVVSRAVLLIMIIIAATFDLGLLGAIGAMIVANVVLVIISYTFAQHIVGFRLRFEPAFARELLRRSWPIGLSIAFNLVYLRGDIVILSLFREPVEIGLYGAAYRVLDVITVIPMMFMGLVLPILVEAWKRHDLETFRRRLQKAFDFSALVALPLAGGAFVLGRKIMMFVAGTEFRASGDLLAVLIVAAFALFFSGLYGHTIVAIGKQRQAIWAYGLNAGLAVIGYFVLIPRVGASGAAWVTVFSEIFIAILLFILTYRFTRVLPNLVVTGKCLGATVLMALVLLALPAWHVIVLVILGSAAYTLFLFLLKAISRDTIKEMLPT